MRNVVRGVDTGVARAPIAVTALASEVNVGVPVARSLTSVQL